MNKIILIGFTALAIIVLGGFFAISKVGKKTDLNSNLPNEKPQKAEGYKGNVLAGSTSPFIEFNRVDFEKAKTDGKIIILDFYANWCPICRAEAPELYAGFDQLNERNVVGFRVNFKDSDTDTDEQALAREFNIPYQHTKVILKNGAEVARLTNQWTREDLVKAVSDSL